MESRLSRCSRDPARFVHRTYFAITILLLLLAGTARAQQRPNILVIFGDDIGQANISRYTHGVVGYMTPNIDRIGAEGMTFTDYYAENSCTAGRSSFITGQSPMRTGLTKVGAPGAPVGLQARDITIAQALKSAGYATGQFGKNHLGDRDEYLPTNHGFDEFFGNLYHLRMDPYERADITSDQYNDWLVHNDYLLILGVMASEEFIETFKEYPPSQAPASFTVNPEAILEMLKYQQSQMHKD